MIDWSESLVYNISKCLDIIIESVFIFDNKYTFMLDNNFELLANSRNFEDEYYLNKKLLQAYNIKIMDILKYNNEKLNKFFEKEFNKIKYQKYLRQIIIRIQRARQKLKIIKKEYSFVRLKIRV